MDNAVALVQAYLHLNGYFTVTEYPVLEATGRSGHRMATDIDVLAFRVPRAGGLVTAGRAEDAEEGREAFVPDPALRSSSEAADLIIAEVKEGRAQLNRGATNPEVLAAVLSRFGRVAIDDLDRSVDDLRRQGHAKLSEHVRARLFAFGAQEGGRGAGYEVILLRHVLRFLESHLREHWDVLRHAQIRDPAFGFLATLEKSK